MISGVNIKNEIIKNKNHLFRSFFPESINNFHFQKIKKFKKFQTVYNWYGRFNTWIKSYLFIFKNTKLKKFVFIDNLDNVF